MSNSEIIENWKGSAELQKEFLGDFKIYLAYADACSAGLVKIVGDNKNL